MKYKYLKLWEYPESYFGDTHYDWYPVCGRSRDSKVLELSNFECFEDFCNELCGQDNVKIVHESHWAVGWVETLMIHKDSPNLDEIDDIKGKLIEDYPVLNDNHYSDMICNEVSEYWGNCLLYERIELCRDSGESVFSARLDYCPDMVYDSLSGEF